MKNISLAINAVLIVAVIVLYYFQFSSGIEEKSSEAGSSSKSMDYSVVYINSDSLLTKYDYFKDIQSQLQDKGLKLEKEYQNRAQGLQQEVNDYQRNVSSLTIGQAKALEENLLKKQQNLRVYQESLSQELMKEESKLNQELYNKITAFLKEYSLTNGIDLVVKYNQGSDVLYAADGMDITNVVIDGLNISYKNTLSGDVSGVKVDTVVSK